MKYFMKYFWYATIVILVGWNWVHNFQFNKVESRLNALEAASTCAQQRQERKHRLGDIVTVDTLVLKYGCTLSVPCRLVPASVP